MSIYVLNLKMQLFQFSNRLNLRRLQKDEHRIQESLEDFLIFRNDFWFCEVSPNFQMSVLFQKFKHGLELDADYEGVRQEVGNIFQYQESRFGRKLNTLVLILTAGAIIVGIFGINADMIGCKINLDKDFFLYVYYRFWVLGRFLLVCAVPMFLLFLHITGRLSRKGIEELAKSVYKKLCAVCRKVRNLL